MPLSGSTVGILAGHGDFPHLLTSRLASAGCSVVVAGLEGQFQNVSDDIEHTCVELRSFPVGAISKQATYFLEHEATRCFFAGGIHWRGVWRHLTLDRCSSKVLWRALWRGDDTILRSVARQFEGLGISVEDPGPYIEDLFLDSDVQVGRPQMDALKDDICLGWRAAKEHGLKDRGQGVVIHRGRIVGRETRLGTDAMLKKTREPGAVLVKVAKPNQDRRFDMPAIGPRTVEIAADKGFAAIVVEAGGVMVFGKNKVLAKCAREGISLMALRNMSPPTWNNV